MLARSLLVAQCKLLQANLRATTLIAVCAINTWAWAQNSPVLGAAAASVPASSSQDAERKTIEQERTKVRGAFEASKTACYQKFAVNHCIETARLEQRDLLADLKRREVALDDMARKTRGIAQQQTTDAKTSPQRQAEISAQRGNALADTAARQTRSQNKQAERAAKLGIVPPPKGPPKQAPKPQPPKPAKPAKVSVDTTAAKAKYDQRIKEAEAHRAKVQAQLQAKQGKPPADSLPIPPIPPN